VGLSFVTDALYLSIVVLGMALLMRTGLVSFGQGLYFCLGAYAAGTLDHFLQLSDLLVCVIAGGLLAAWSPRFSGCCSASIATSFSRC
jgi:branched-chain amino acid transport system permease protein